MREYMYYVYVYTRIGIVELDTYEEQAEEWKKKEIFILYSFIYIYAL